RVERVERDVHRVVSARLEAEELDVDHVTDPRERMPVRLVVPGQRPANVLESEPGRHVRIALDVRGVVEADEAGVERRPVAQDGGRDQGGEPEPGSRGGAPEGHGGTTYRTLWSVCDDALPPRSGNSFPCGRTPAPFPRAATIG